VIKSVKWTKTAKKNFSDIKHYLEAEWGKSVCDSFHDKVEEFTSLIKDFPGLGSTEVQSKGIKGFKLTKQV